MKRKILLAVLAAAMVALIAGSALPALAQHDQWGGSQQDGSSWSQSDPQAPPQPICDWDWDRDLWRDYGFELWFYACDYGDGNTSVSALWNPDWGYWSPSQ